MDTPSISAERAPTQAAILEAVKKAEKPIGPQEIVDRTGLPKSSVQPTLKKMVDAGYLAKPDYGLYDLPENVPAEGGEEDQGREALPETPEEAEEMPPSELKRWGLSRIEHMSIEVSAGDGREVHLEEVTGATILPTWYVRQEFGVSPERVKRVKVVGDSMVPTLRPGQHIFVVLLNGDEAVSNGVIYVLDGPEGLMIKRLYLDAEIVTNGENGEAKEDVKRYVRIWSENEAAGRYRVPLEVFERDYRLIAYLAKAEVSL